MTTQPDVPRSGHHPLTVWRDRPAVIAGLYVLLLVAGASTGPLGHAAGTAPGHVGDALLVSWVVAFWLTWRASRRGQVARCLLVIFSGLGCVNAAWHVPGHHAALVLLAVYAGQVVLMLSPALSRHDSLPACDAPPRA